MSMIFITISVLLIIGTGLKWGILVDPPEEWSRQYINSWLKEKFGKDILPAFNYTLGGIMLFLSIMSLLLPSTK